MYIYMEIHLKESYFAGNCTIFHRLFFLSHLSLRTYKSNKKNIHEKANLHPTLCIPDERNALCTINMVQ